MRQCSRRLGLTCILILFVFRSLEAHVVSQLYAELHADGDEWHLEVLFDAGYADPASRDDLFSPQPTRDWLVALPAAEQKRLTNEAEIYLREVLDLRSGGEKISCLVEFPDFDVNPPAFPKLLNDGAYFHVELSPVEPRRGDLVVGMAAGDHPDLVVKVVGADGPEYLIVASGEQVDLLRDDKVSSGDHPLAVAFWQGVLHVIPKGLDHILFVLALFLLQRSWRSLLYQSLAFTLAHTITLGLAVAGLVNVPGKIVEPLIALSITALAVENILVNEAKPWRLGLVFGFGLIHGLGFAGVLSAWIRPGEGFLATLVAANLGVEVGQVTVLAAAWILTLGWHEKPVWLPFRRGACIVLGLIGLWWFAERADILELFTT